MYNFKDRVISRYDADAYMNVQWVQQHSNDLYKLQLSRIPVLGVEEGVDKKSYH
jgi:hypothetical protein